MSGGGFNNMFSQMGQPPSSSGGSTQPAQFQQQPGYQPPPGPNTGYNRPLFNTDPNMQSPMQNEWMRGATGQTEPGKVNARNLAALPEDQRAGYKPLSNVDAYSQTLRENIQAGMGNYGGMVNYANKQGISQTDIQQAIGANTDMYTYMNRPNYQQYSPANNQYNPTIYQSNYQNYARPATQFDVSTYGTQPVSSPAYSSGMSRDNINQQIGNYFQQNPNSSINQTLDAMRSGGVNRTDIQSFGGYNNYGPQMGMPQMNTPFNPYTNSYQQQSPFSYQQQTYQPQMQSPFSYQPAQQQMPPYAAMGMGPNPANLAPKTEADWNIFSSMARFAPGTDMEKAKADFLSGNQGKPQMPANPGFNTNYGGGSMDFGNSGYFTPMQPAPMPQRTSSGPSQAIVGRSSQMRGTPNVMRRAEGGITSLMDDAE
jgi:hypothetical protein